MSFARPQQFFQTLTHQTELATRAHYSVSQTMPNLKNFQYDRARHFRMMDRNLCANLIRHEHIITGRAKAKRAQAKIEHFLGKALHQNRQIGDKSLKERLSSVKALEFLQVPDRQECGTKVLEDLSQRFLNRTHGFTRIIKLERRLADDKAEMSCLELVDSDLEVKFWYTAKIVARLELQNLPIDELTALNVRKLTQLRVNGEERFRAAVEEAKEVFFAGDVAKIKQLAESAGKGTVSADDIEQSVDLAAIVDDWPQHLQKRSTWGTYLHNKPTDLFARFAKKFVQSKKYLFEPRPAKEAVELPKSPFLK